jgi:hypothetical protein
MLDEIMQNIQDDYKECWKHPDNEMYHWALDMEQHHAQHGLGDLSKPCEPQLPGEQCPACGRCF